MTLEALSDLPLSTQIAAIQKGLPGNSLSVLSRKLGIPKQRIISGLKLARRTISQREKPGQRFTLEESERLFRVVRIRRLVRQVFTTDQAIAQWLNSSDRSLGMASPLEMLATDLGMAKVENLAKAMMHGVPV